MRKIRVNRDVILNHEYSLRQEYLLTNGNGGYSSSSILDCHRRKHHGLLVLPYGKGGKLFNLLSKLEVSIKAGKNLLHLSTNKFPGVYYPTGHQYIDHFEMEYFPVTVYRIGELLVAKSIIMPFRSNTVLVKYELLEGDTSVILRAMPFLAFREVNSIVRENIALRQRTYFEENGFKIAPYEGMPELYLQTSRRSVFFPSPIWWSNFEYMKDYNRGYDYQEDLFSPGVFEVRLRPGQAVIFRASIDPLPLRITQKWTREVKRLEQLHLKFKNEPEPLATLKTHASDYIIEYSREQKGLVAGYHWFQEWGRDTMIALPGLTMACGELSTAMAILERYARFENNGLLPNIIDPEGNHAYNSVDTSLLFFWAIQQFLHYGGSIEKVQKSLLKTMLSIVTAYLESRVPEAGLGEDGLLYAGNKHTQLTWMDAMVNGIPVTPRNGAPVEINALWYNALKFLLNEFGDYLDTSLSGILNEQVDRFEESFIDRFWNSAKGCLYDIYRPEGGDPSIRPNQLFALGLPYSCISTDKALLVLETVAQHLVTPFGLRTLSPEDPRYNADYRGDPGRRDHAYHQGTIWPWLTGIYVDALLAFREDKKRVKIEVLDRFKNLWETHLEQYGVFHISEIFNPNRPHTAKGCIAQAWSMGELIRALDKLQKL
ncbi:glycogen debranching enzyme family protein [bacterium]|nr:glycogen debranching enzyme family protein [bacterium]